MNSAKHRFVLSVAFVASCAAVTFASQSAMASQCGMASWYSDGMTASGERMNSAAMSAAHRSLPFGTHVKVENMDNGRSVIVRINDRGPFVTGRVIDLSPAAAKQIGMIGSGVADVRLTVMDGASQLKGCT